MSTTEAVVAITVSFLFVYLFIYFAKGVAKYHQLHHKFLLCETCRVLGFTVERLVAIISPLQALYAVYCWID